MKNSLFLSGALIAIIVGMLIAFGFFNNANAPTHGEVKWLTYKNTQYAFEIQYPDTWQVAEDASLPVINFYKKGEIAKPPFTMHSTTTAIAIFPQGLGTEGPQSETRPSTVVFAEPTKHAMDFLLKDGTPWGTFAFFASTSTSLEWNEFAFIWAGVEVKDLALNCVTKNGVSVPGNCEFGIEALEAKTVRTGTTNAIDRAIEETMMKSFKFVK